MKNRFPKRLLGFGLVGSFSVLSGCANLGPTGGHRAAFTAGTITSLSPSTIMAGSPPFLLTVNGSNLAQANSDILVWNGGQQIPEVPGDPFNTTQATFAIDAALIANPGTISLHMIDEAPGDRPSNTVTFTVASRGSTSCALFGLYNFLFTGFQTNTKGFGIDNGPVMAVAAFGVDANGNVSGEEDGTGLGGAPFTGTCTNGTAPDQGTLTFKFAQPGFISDTFNYSFVLQQGGNGPSRGRFVEPSESTSFFGTISGSGVFIAVAPDSALNGDYAFGLVGMEAVAGLGSKIGIAGRFTYSSGNVTVGVADINNGGVVTANAPVSGSMFPNTPPDLYSRVVRDLTIAGQQASLAIYANSSGGGFAFGQVNIQGARPNVIGFISSQANAGAYSNASLNAPVVFSTWGVPSPLYTGSSFTAPSDTTLGVATGFNSGAGTFSLQFDNVSGGVAHLNQVVSGATYSVASNGRATVSYTLGGNTVNYVYYLDGANDGFILGESGTAAEFGFLQPQATGPFTTASINGTFASATFFPLVPASPNLATEITLINGTLSANTPAGALTGTYAIAASGRGTATVNLPVLGGQDLVFYVISPGTVVVMGSDNTTSNAIAFMHF